MPTDNRCLHVARALAIANYKVIIILVKFMEFINNRELTAAFGVRNRSVYILSGLKLRLKLFQRY